VEPTDPSLDGGPLDGRLHGALRAHLRYAGASFWPDLLGAAGNPPEPELLAALFDLVWAGEVTNDTFAPLRASRSTRKPARAAGRRPAVGRLSRLGPPAAAGRWSLVAGLGTSEAPPTARSHARAELLLARHGIVTRDGIRAEGVAGGFASLYPVWRAMEEASRVRRGWFVDGLGAAQFASSGAVERLRSLREPLPEPAVAVLAACDPANPYGAALPWPESRGRPARTAGAIVVLCDGQLVAFVERGGRSVLTFGAGGPDAWAEALVVAHKDGRVPNLEVRTIDGEPARTSPAAPALMACGFSQGYRGLTLR